MVAADLVRLRLDLTNQGVRIGEDLLAAGFGLLLEGPDAPEGIDLLLPGGGWVNVSVAPGYARTSPYTLVGADCQRIGDREVPQFLLRHRHRGDISVQVPSTARFRHQRTPTGMSCGDIGAIHGPWFVTAPIAPVADLALDRPRRFLGLPPTRPLTKRRWSVDEVVATAEAAWVHGGARLIHLEAGHLLTDDGGVAELTPYLQALHRALPTLISVSVLPPADPAAVLHLYRAGADAVSYHLLAWDEAAATTVAPLRARFVPHRRIRAALREAARIFPRGAVSTDLLVGLEPLEHLDDALPLLCAEGVVPNLALFRPLPGAEADAPQSELVPTEPLLAVMDERRRHIQAHGLWHSRVRGFPRTVSGVDPYRPGLMARCYAGLRRRLRVAEEVAS